MAHIERCEWNRQEVLKKRSGVGKNMTDKRTKKAEKIYVKRPYVSQLSEGGLGREEDDAAAATCNMR